MGMCRKKTACNTWIGTTDDVLSFSSHRVLLTTSTNSDHAEITLHFTLCPALSEPGAGTP